MIEGGGVPAYLAYLAGVISFASACVLPIVPAYLLIVAGAGVVPAEGSRRAATVRYALLFLVGFAALFVATGATASNVGSRTREALPFFEVAGAIAVGIAGVALLAAPRTSIGTERGLPPLLAVCVLFAGAGFAAAWTPCIGPVLAEILLYGSFSETLREGVLLLILFAAGLATPFLALGLFVARAIGGERMGSPLVLSLSGILLLAMGTTLLTGHFARVTAYLASFGTLIDFGI